MWKLTKIETSLIFDSIGQKILENNFPSYKSCKKSTFFFNHVFHFFFFFFFFFLFFCIRLIKIHEFSKCLSVVYKIKSHSLYGEKRKVRPYIETKLQFLHNLYGGSFIYDVLCYTYKGQNCQKIIFLHINHVKKIISSLYRDEFFFFNHVFFFFFFFFFLY